MIKAVVFDLDDTLISEKQYINSGFKYISKMLSNRLKKNEVEIFEVMLSLFREDTKNVFNRLFEIYDAPYVEKDIIKLIKAYRNHEPNINFYSDVIPTIEQLKKNGIKLGIITDGYRNSQKKKIEKLNANDYFEKIIITDELGREYWKPHPKPFELMKKELKVKFEEMIYIGDNPQKDFYINQTYPIETVRITRENSIYKSEGYYKDVKESHSITNLSDILLYL